MKRKVRITAAALAAAMLVSLLCSCGVNITVPGIPGVQDDQSGTEIPDNPDNGTGSGAGDKPDDDLPEELPENLIYALEVHPVLICNDTKGCAAILETLGLAVFQTTYLRPRVFGDSEPEADHEIVVGMTNREISVTAYEKLSELDRGDEDVAYLIYSDGSSVAIAYEGDRYGMNLALSEARSIVKDIFNGDEQIIIPEGVIASAGFNPMEHQLAIDAARDAEGWINFENKVDDLGGDGAAVAAAVKEYYEKICTDDIIDWFAGLYDPYIGGYYFSNDARDNRGYLPDIESTGQALGFFETSGMFNYVEDDGSVTAGFHTYVLGLPEWFRNQIVAFLKGLQDPETGFFYHPQWTKAMVDEKLSRRARDMGNAEGTLRYLGHKPTYDTPNGVTGDGILWDGTPVSGSEVRLTGKLILSNAYSAVSMLVPAAAVADHLVSDVTFKAYLADMEYQNSIGRRTFYWIGNTIGSQVSQIMKRDEQLKAEGAGYSLGDILIEWYTKHQNKETGLWDKGLTYENTNALLKIGGTYTSFGYVFPNADKALDSCLKMTMTDEQADAVVQVYNVWYAIRNLMDNLNKLSTTPEQRAKAAEVRHRLLIGAPEAIKLSMEKQLRFKQPDGSFSYAYGMNCTTSQGLPVSPAGDGEGDINATAIVASGTINNCLYALGIKQYTPSFFSEADRLRYIDLLEQRTPIVKNDIDKRGGGSGITAGKYFTDYGDAALSFNNRELADTPLYTSFDGERGDAYMTAVSPGNHALTLTKDGVNTNGKPAVWADVVDKAGGRGNCLVLEMDAKISGTADFHDNEYRTVDGVITHFYTTAINIAFGTTAPSEMKYHDWKTPDEHVLDTQIYMTDDTRHEAGAFGGGNALDFDSWLGGGTQFECDRWYNICIEFYELDTEGAAIGVKVYLDGVNVANFTKASYTATDTGFNKPSDAKSVRLDLMDRFAPSEVLIDDLFAGVISKEYK